LKILCRAGRKSRPTVRPNYARCFIRLISRLNSQLALMCTLGSVNNQFLTFSMVFALSLCACSAFCEEEGRQGADAVRIEDVEFKNGDLTLHGNLYLPKKPGKYPALIVYHSASGGIRAYPAYQHLADVLPAKGVAVLLFDRRGFGQSQGNFETANFADLASDGIAGIRYLKAGRTSIQDISEFGVSARAAGSRHWRA
jgi:predicted acyl esterase